MCETPQGRGKGATRAPRHFGEWCVCVCVCWRAKLPRIQLQRRHVVEQVGARAVRVEDEAVHLPHKDPPLSPRGYPFRELDEAEPLSIAVAVAYLHHVLIGSSPCFHLGFSGGVLWGLGGKAALRRESGVG